MTRFLYLLILTISIHSCTEVNEQLDKKMENYLFDELPYLATNPFSEEKLVLGEKLFTIGCQAACHLSEFGWTSGNQNFPGGFGRGFNAVGEPGVNVFDDRGLDIPPIKCLGIEGIGFREEFGASGRFKDAESQAAFAEAGHQLIPYDTLFSSIVEPFVLEAFPGINIDSLKLDTLKMDKIVGDAIGIFERTEWPYLKFYEVPASEWTQQERIDALLFINSCGTCHSRKDWSGPPSTLGRPLLPFHPDNCAESGVMDKPLRAVPNLINVGKHTFWFYDAQATSTKQAIEEHNLGLTEEEIDRLDRWMNEFLTEKENETRISSKAK